MLPLTIKASGTASLSFAMHQNYIPLISRLCISNESEETLEQLTVRIRFSPAFAAPYETKLAAVQPGGCVEISPVRIAVDTDFLCSLTEKMAASYTVEVLPPASEEAAPSTAEDAEEASAGTGSVLCSMTQEVELLAYDQWTGTAVMPELTAAFITPNHPKIAEITAAAGKHLMKWTGEPSFTGYQTLDPNQVKLQLAALYAALQEENIAYTVPPASYEDVGQRLRMPHTVLEQKSGTCLDLSLLFAACAEAVGLHPLIIFIKGHAFAGCWLEPETFSDCAVDDVSAVTKRTAAGIDQICLVECTDYVAGRSVSFDEAGAHALEHLKNAEDFQLVLDVKHCRSTGIRPVPVRVNEDGVYKTIDYGARKQSDLTARPEEISRHNIVTDQGISGEFTRQELWERKLLDLSLRNSLLNFRPGGASVQLMTFDLTALEQELAGGHDFKIISAPAELHFALSDAKIFEAENDKDTVTSLAETEFESHRLRAFIGEGDLERSLKKLHRQAKVSLEENGCNTLYLALGFLRWYETDKSTRPRYAPLLLVPVDLVRKITDKSYSLRVRGEDVQMNITLLEMLRQDHGILIGGINPPPETEKGIDIPLVFNTVRQAVMAKKGWDVEEHAFIGQFSFSQFIMWNDIRNRSDELRRNHVVASLISGKLEWEPQDVSISPAELDDKVAPSDMAVPVSADSSQLAAVYAASQGQSFVLHGPPGTGKSQTITNMIANALYNGKSVLFVAEKMAALSVVQKRLAKLGLDPFCLELHSNKAQKRAVLNQLEQTLAIGHVKSPEEYQRTADELKRRRAALNEIMTALHEPQPIGMSLYEAITLYESLSEYKNCITLDADYPEKTSAEAHQAVLDSLSRVIAAGKEIGGYQSSPLKHYRRTAYDINTRDSFKKAAEQLRSLLPGAGESYRKLLQEMQLTGCTDHASYTGILTMLGLAVSGEYLPTQLAANAPAVTRSADLQTLLGEGRQYQQMEAKVLERFEKTVLAVDASAVRLQWKENEQKWFLPKMLGSGKIVKSLQLHARNAGAVTKENFLAVCDELVALTEQRQKLTGADSQLTDVFGALWQADKSDFDKLDRCLQGTSAMRETLAKLQTPALADAMQRPLPGSYQEAQTAYEKLQACTDALQKDYAIDFTEAFSAPDWFAAAKTEDDGWIDGSTLLRERSILEELLNDLSARGLDAIVSAYRSGFVHEDTITDAYRCEASRVTIASAMHKYPALSGFQGTQFEFSLSQFAELNSKFEALTVQELCARLSAKIPAASEGMKGSSEISVLQRAIKSGGRMLSIRKLFDSIPTLLRRICPCMLMSPISVAQYIDPSFPHFDLVVFDEASQLPTSEAVGAIARGDNVIVVGDPKQLPPTSFFTAQHTDEENYDKEDLESVLDDCLALSMPSMHLLWHYRSRHESLIAFSNAKFYENKLLTFPSPDDQIRKVTRVQVEGFYDKSKTRQNRAEAEAVVNEIVRRLSDETLRKDSIGVVTFSVVQQNLVDDLLTEAYVKDPQLEAYANEMYEPIIIKNLENVQGDERDVILFSIGYGPDQEGKVSMNFGPVNQDGGWRRLNVAVSRARKEMKVFSVIRPDQIDLTRTRSDGVAQLRAFLEFADRGTQVLARGANASVYKNDAFAELVRDELAKYGYTVKCGIGCSGFRVDAAVVHPDDPGRFVLGLLCDSSTNWHTSTARDRLLSQPSVLRGLGWKLCSVHILDWLDNKERVIERIRQAIADAVAGTPDPVQTETVKPVSYSAANFEKEHIPIPAELASPYTTCILPDMGTSDEFQQPATLRKIADTIAKVIDTEAPVSRKTVLRRVIAAWGITRSSARTEQIFEAALQKVKPQKTTSRGNVFLWKQEQDPAAYETFRNGGEKRAIDDICTEELCYAMCCVIRAQVSIPQSDLVRETAKLFGFARVTPLIEQAAAEALQLAVEHGTASVENDVVTLME